MKRVSSFTVIVAFVCLALVGVALIPLLPVKLNPSRSLPGFTVGFSMPGTSSRVVEMEVTSKLESMLARIRGVKRLNSTSGNGYGNITVELDKDADVEAVRFEASTIIRQTWPQLPEGVSYPTIHMKVPDENASRPFMSFTLNAPSTPILIQQYAEEHIKPRLANIPGIYKVELSGATPMEWRLEYDSEQLRLLGVTLSDISEAVQRHYRKEFLGTHNVDTGNGSREWIRLALVPESNSLGFNPAAITVTATDGKLLRLDELVSAVRMEEEPQSYYRINGLNSVYLSITAEETANQLQLNRAVMDEMEAVRQVLPVGYEVHTSYDATEYIREELDKIYFRTGLTVLILLVFVWLITRKLKYLFLIVTSLAVNIAVALIFYYLFGLEMQLYSLAGITVSLNLVIDSTIVMTDHILHRRNLKAFLSVLAATLTTMGALVIIFFLDEKIRLNLQDFAAVVIINLAVSLMVALFFVPSMIEKIGLVRRITGKKRRLVLPGLTQTFKTRLGRIFRRFPVYFSCCYSALIRFLCRWRWAVCLLLLLGFGLPVFLLPDKLEGGGKWEAAYNKVFGSDTYKESVKPIVDKALHTDAVEGIGGDGIVLGQVIFRLCHGKRKEIGSGLLGYSLCIVNILLLHLFVLQRLNPAFPTERIVTDQTLRVAQTNRNTGELGILVSTEAPHIAQLRIQIERTARQVEILSDGKIAVCIEGLLAAIDVKVLFGVVTLGDIAVVLCRSHVQRQAGKAVCLIGAVFPITGQIHVLGAEGFQRTVIRQGNGLLQIERYPLLGKSGKGSQTEQKYKT